MAEPEPEAPLAPLGQPAAAAGSWEVLALRWTIDSVQAARKRDVLRWCRAHCSASFLADRKLVGAGSIDSIAKTRSAAELHAVYAEAIEPRTRALLPKPRLLYYFQIGERERDDTPAEEQGQTGRLLLAELEAAGWTRTENPSAAALLLGEKPGSEPRTPRVLPGSVEAAQVNHANRLSDSGDAAYKQESYLQAIEQYTSALASLQPSAAAARILDPPLAAKIFVNRSLCWTARAKVLVRSGEFRASTRSDEAHAAMTSAIADALAAVAIRPNWARGHYRHGLALWAMHHDQCERSGTSSLEARVARAGLSAAYSAVEQAQRLQNVVTFARKKNQLKQKLEELGVPVPRQSSAARLDVQHAGTHNAGNADVLTAIETLQWLESFRQASNKEEFYSHLLATATAAASRSRRGSSSRNKRSRDAKDLCSTCGCGCGCGADGLCVDVCNRLTFLPPTAIVRNVDEVPAQLARLRAQQRNTQESGGGREADACGWFVKHPQGGGGTGTVFAPDAKSVRDAVGEVLGGSSGAGHSSCAVVQRAVSTTNQATLPKGPSRLELRVYVLFRRKAAWVFSGMRVKTAALEGGSALNNKKVQQACAETWGAFYPNNSLDAEQLEAEGALPAGTFEAVTRPQIYAAMATTHAAVCEHIEDQGFLLFGADILVGKDGAPTMLELNVKPCSRFLHQDQFESPVAQRMSRAAVRGLVAMLTSELVGVQELVRACQAEHRSSLRWDIVAGDAPSSVVRM